MNFIKLLVFFVSVIGVSFTYALDIKDRILGFDFEYRNADFIFLVNDDQPYDFLEALGGLGSMKSSINFNDFLFEGVNSISIEPVFFKEDSYFKIRFRCEESLRYSSFKNGGLFEISVFMKGADMVVEDSMIGDQCGIEYIGYEVVSSKYREDSLKAVVVSFNSPLVAPEKSWSKKGVNLNKQKRDQIVDLYKAIYRDLKEDINNFKYIFEDSLKNSAESYDESLDSWYENMFSELFDPEYNFSLRAFDAKNSDIVIYGGGKLVSLSPQPISYESTYLDSVFRPNIAFWKDTEGKWHLRD